MVTAISLIGASGRMGQLTSRLIAENPDLKLHSELGSKSDLEVSLGADLLIDFTNPTVSETIVDFALKHNLRLLVGSSGWSKEKLDELSERIRGTSATITVVPNFSIGSVLASKFAAEAARYFDSVEITETHDIKKIDAPSGTALFTSKIISEARSGRPSTSNTDDAPVFNGVPIKSVRIDGIHAKQDVVLRQPGESLMVHHEVTTHEVYARGILLAIRKTLLLGGLNVGLVELLEDNG